MEGSRVEDGGEGRLERPVGERGEVRVEGGRRMRPRLRQRAPTKSKCEGETVLPYNGQRGEYTDR